MALDRDELQKRLQAVMQEVLVSVVGSGLSCAEGLPGMGALATHLVKNVAPQEEERTVWERACARFSVDGLELALQQVPVGESLRAKIVHATHGLIVEKEGDAIRRALRGEELPLARLLRKYLKANGRRATVVTTNYDRLVEIAAEQAEGVVYTGFTVGGIRRWDNVQKPWRVVRHGYGKKPTNEPTVYVWKVHGSVDWFHTDQGVRATSFVAEMAKNHRPVLVAPGSAKYEETHQEPYRSVVGEADRAMKEAKGFLCLGYGFNDAHVQPKLLESARRPTNPAHVVLLTQELTEAARRILIHERCPKFIALTHHDEGVRVFTNDEPGGTILAGPPIWKLAEFLTWIWG